MHCRTRKGNITPYIITRTEPRHTILRCRLRVILMVRIHKKRKSFKIFREKVGDHENAYHAKGHAK